MFYLTLRKRKLSFDGINVAGRSDLIARTKAGLCVENAVSTCGRRARFANPAQSDWREKTAIQSVFVTCIAKKPGCIPETVAIEWVWEFSLQIRPELMNKDCQISE